jgi:hypothetical protein
VYAVDYFDLLLKKGDEEKVFNQVVAVAVAKFSGKNNNMLL